MWTVRLIGFTSFGRSFPAPDISDTHAFDRRGEKSQRTSGWVAEIEIVTNALV